VVVVGKRGWAGSVVVRGPWFEVFGRDGTGGGGGESARGVGWLVGVRRVVGGSGRGAVVECR